MSRSQTTVTKTAIVAACKIDASDRLRPVDPAKVQLIADGIRAWRAGGNEGIPAPITVRPLGGVRPLGDDVADISYFKLVAGAHRLAAVQLLGDHEVDVIIHDLDDLQARLMEIDENLYRNELNALDRAAFLTERDRVWREMYPDKVGSKGSNKARWHGVDRNENFSFGADAAEKVGLSQRSIQMDVKMFRMLSLTPEVIDLVRGTWLEDHQGQLKALARVPGADRLDALQRMLRDDSPARNVASALAEMRGVVAEPAAPDEKSFAALVSQWTRASAKTRGRFLDHLHSTGALDDYMLGAEG